MEDIHETRENPFQHAGRPRERREFAALAGDARSVAWSKTKRAVVVLEARRSVVLRFRYAALPFRGEARRHSLLVPLVSL